jgi:ubiquinone biosynthesis protein UbiJ
MADRKMTFTIPEELAGQLLRRVALRDRSRYVSEAIAAKLGEREERLIRACEVANQEADVLMMEHDWDAMADRTDQLEDPWTMAPPR